MKKLLKYLSIVGFVSPVFSQVTSCYIGEQTIEKYLEKLNDYDWSSDDGSDELNYSNSSKTHTTSFTSQGSTQTITPNNENEYLDFSTYNTGYKYKNTIDKQATTGTPLNESFMPNGNELSDFGVNSKSRKYNKINSILDWSPETDNDSEYNVSTKSISQRVAVPTIASDSLLNTTKWEAFRNDTKDSSALSSSCVGMKTVLANSLTNYSYLDTNISWAGSYIEGIIVPPDADNIEACHVNGVNIYGNIFLDGYHGLTKEELSDFLQTDSNGNYLIVDVLIKLAVYNGFDGWFINNEANGALPNGSILSYQTLNNIVKQFKEKIASSNDESEKNLKIQMYKNNGTLGYSATSNTYSDKESVSYTNVADEISVNFNKPYTSNTDYNHNHTPNSVKHFLSNEGKNFGGENIYNLLDFEWYNNFWGSYDFNEISYASNYKNNIFDSYNYNSKYHNSIGTFDSKAGMTFNVDSINVNPESNNSNVREQLFKEQISNLYNNEQVFGSNLSTSSSDTGYRVSDSYTYSDGTNSKLFSHIDANDFIQADPRVIKSSDVEQSDTSSMEPYFDYSSSDNTSRTNTRSSGIANAKNAKTTIFDKKRNDSGSVLNETNDCSMKTNFSLGNGIKFVSNDGTTYGDTNVDKDENYYSWTNKRLVDVAPTYQWEIRKVDNGKIDDQTLPIDQISGQYDYDDVYRKGNSIAISSGFNSTGSLEDAIFTKGQQYNWNVMGTDLRSNNHKIYFVAKTNKEDSVNDIKLSITTTNQSGEYNSSTTFVSPTKQETLENGWTKYELDLSSVSSVNIDNDNPVTKLGVSFKAEDSNFKFNIGEFGIDVDDFDNSDNLSITNQNVDYVVKRNDNNINIRFGWDASNTDSLDYYEIYWYDKNGQGYRVGETTQNVYYLKELSESSQGKVSIGIRPVYKDGSIGNENRFDVEV